MRPGWGATQLRVDFITAVLAEMRESLYFQVRVHDGSRLTHTNLPNACGEPPVSTFCFVLFGFASEARGFVRIPFAVVDRNLRVWAKGTRHIHLVIFHARSDN